MQVDTKFAITVPCYKSESTIADTLRGIISQGEEALRRVACVVIADDMSPDNTLAVVRETWNVDWPPLKFSSCRKNVGEMVNVNTAVASLPAGVEWFLHMHGDNIPKPEWLMMITDQCLSAGPNVGIVCASYDVFDGDGKIETGEDIPEAEPTLVEGGIPSLRGTVRRGCWWHNSCGAIRTSTFRETGGLPPGMRQKGDWDLLLRILAANWDIQYIPRTLMLYRAHEQSASSFAFARHLDIEESLQVIQKHAPVLTAADILSVHFSYLRYLLRRVAASLYRLQFTRLSTALLMLLRTCFSSLSCLTVPKDSRLEIG